MKLLSSEEIVTVMERFKARNPNPKSELVWSSPFTLLVAVVLSAQATDRSVNLATPALFAAADSPEKMLALGEDGLIPYIQSIGLYKSKARHVIGLCKKLLADFGGEVPHDRDALMSLPGVGRKTANVVLNVVWGEHTMPVDTHLLRICPKIGLAEGDTPEKVERSLLARIPDVYLEHAHHWLILHGRYVCTARKPKCGECCLADICKRNET
ncbi:MAG: endonuclease III [Treponema sp.]|nr:endonuclease III [Treponema sp.]